MEYGYNPDSWANEGLSIDGGSLLLNLFMYWSLSEGLMHKGIIRLLKGVFMDKFSVSLALDMCANSLGHIKCISPGNALFNIQCDTIINEITMAMRIVNGLDSDTQLLLDNLVSIDSSLAEALGYFFLYRTVEDGSLIMSIDKALSDAATGLLSIIPKEYNVEDDSEMDEPMKDDGIIRLWRCDYEDIVEE